MERLHGTAKQFTQGEMKWNTTEQFTNVNGGLRGHTFKRRSLGAGFRVNIRGDTGDLGSLKPGKATVTLDPQIGTNVNGVTLPSNYYNKKVVGYFPSYAITSQAHEYFNIADLQWDKLTHIQYAFGIVNKDTCELEVGDPNMTLKVSLKAQPLNMTDR